MNGLFKAFLRLKPNHILMINICIILIIFIVFQKYHSTKLGGVQRMTKNNISYKIIINKTAIAENEILLINLYAKNLSKQSKILKFTKENVFNLVIANNDGIIFKRDIMERKNKKEKILIIPGHRTFVFSYEWLQNSNTDMKIKKGLYELNLYSKDLDISLTLNFSIE